MIHSFLLIGQSNMAGRGFLSEACEIDVRHIKTLRNGRWQQMFRPINPDRSTAGVNLAESFAEAYAAKYGVDVGLICCADGGTSLEQWQEGSILYENAVNQARLAMRTSNIVGILWHQGEADREATLASTYVERFEKMITAMKRDIGIGDMPVILGELGEFLGTSTVVNYRTVNEQLHKIAERNTYTGVASSKGLTSNPDNLHFNAKSLYEFGLRYFAEFEKLCDSDRVLEEKDDDVHRTDMELL